MNTTRREATKAELKSWQKLFALLLALAWMPLLNSCEIAHAFGVELPHRDECHPTEPAPTHACDHCDFCQTIDSGGVLMSVAHVTLPGGVDFISYRQPTLTARRVEKLRGEIILRPDPDHPPQRWRFTERTALPPRAPSFVS